MKKKFQAAVVCIIFATFLPSQVFALETSGFVKSAGQTKSTSPIKKVAYRSERIAKHDDASCFVDILTLGKTTTVKFGSGISQVFKYDNDGRLESVNSDGRLLALRYEGAGRNTKFIGVDGHDGAFISVESIREKAKRKHGLAPKMNSVEAFTYLQNKMEKIWCANSQGMKKASFMKVDAEDIPPYMYDQDYWEDFIISAPRYDPNCNESDCTSFITEWRDLELGICAIGATVFFFAPIAAVIIGAACSGATFAIWGNRMTECGNPPTSWGCY